MAVRSYVCPSAAITGFVIATCMCRAPYKCHYQTLPYNPSDEWVSTRTILSLEGGSPNPTRAVEAGCACCNKHSCMCSWLCIAIGHFDRCMACSCNFCGVTCSAVYSSTQQGAILAMSVGQVWMCCIRYNPYFCGLRIMEEHPHAHIHEARMCQTL